MSSAFVSLNPGGRNQGRGGQFDPKNETPGNEQRSRLLTIEYRVPYGLPKV
jgi:hypothetical protein